MENILSCPLAHNIHKNQLYMKGKIITLVEYNVGCLHGFGTSQAGNRRH